MTEGFVVHVFLEIFESDPHVFALKHLLAEVKTFLAEKGFGFIESAVPSEGHEPLRR